MANHVVYLGGLKVLGNAINLKIDNVSKTIPLPIKPEAWKSIFRCYGDYEIEFSPEILKNNLTIASSSTKLYGNFNSEGQLEATIDFSVSQQSSFSYTIDLRK